MKPTPLLLLLVVVTGFMASPCMAQNASDATPFLPCEEKNDPIGLRIKGCTQLPCAIEKGSTAEMEVDFEVGWDVEQLNAVVTAYALGIVIDFPLKQKNACKSLTNGECPLDQYEEVTYKLELDVDKSYPSISLAVAIALQDKSKKQMMCFKVNLQVVDPK